MVRLSAVEALQGRSGSAAGRDALLRSLDHQRRTLAESIVLTPVDSLPFSLVDREHTGFLHGLYLTDKQRDREGRKRSPILFGGREQAVEDLAYIHRLMADALGAATGSLRLLSGLQAHAATFMSISSSGQTVMLLSEEAGGHFSTHAILSRLGLRTVDMPVDHERLCVDRAATLDLVERVRPDFIFVDRSEGLRYEDFAFIGELQGPVKVFDASQYLAQIVTGRYENPLAWGFDLMLFSLHKSFPGPQKAGVVSREDGRLWAELIAGLSTLVSSSHPEDTYLVGLTLLRRDWLETYVDRALETANALEESLSLRGVDVLRRSNQGSPTWPGTQHLWLRFPHRDAAFTRYERLGHVNVHTNYRRLPYDLGYGLRLGTTFASVAGLCADHAPELADIVATAIEGGGGEALRGRVRDLAENTRVKAIVPPEYWT